MQKPMSETVEWSNELLFLAAIRGAVFLVLWGIPFLLEHLQGNYLASAIPLTPAELAALDAEEIKFLHTMETVGERSVVMLGIAICLGFLVTQVPLGVLFSTPILCALLMFTSFDYRVRADLYAGRLHLEPKAATAKNRITPADLPFVGSLILTMNAEELNARLNRERHQVKTK